MLEGETLDVGEDAALLEQLGALGLDLHSAVLLGDELPLNLDIVRVAVFDRVGEDVELGREDGGLSSATSGDTFAGVEGSHEVILLEGLLDDTLDSWNSGGSSDDLDGVNLDLLGHYFREEFLTVLFDFLKNRLNESFKLLSLENVVNIVVLNEGLDTELGLLVGGESFSLLLDDVENSDDGLLVLEDGKSV